MLKTLFLITLLTSASLFAVSQQRASGCAAGSSLWPSSLHQGLVAWYPFNGNANDESGNGNNPDSVGATLTTDRFGIGNAAYHFDGHQFIRGSCSKYPAAQRTISFWYKATDFTLNNDAFGYGGNGDCGFSWITIFANGVFGVAGHCSYFDTFVGSPLPLYNYWHNIVVTYNGTNITIYVDGCVVISALRTVNNSVINDKFFYIGTMPDVDGVHPYINPIHQFWLGDLDDVAIWDRALSDEEVKIVAQAVCPPSITISSNPGPVICEGTNVEFSTTIENYTGAVFYQWQINDMPVGGNNATFSDASLANHDTVRCILLSTSGCLLDSSNSIAIVVKPIPQLGISIASDDTDNIICANSPITFTAIPVNATGSGIYQWTVDGTDVGSNSPEYKTTTLLSNAIVSCQFTAKDNTCLNGNPARSNSIAVKVTPVQPNSISIISDDSDNIICRGTAVNFSVSSLIANPEPSYQWTLNGTSTGSTGPSYSGGNFTDKDLIQCIATSNQLCAVPATTMSNSIQLRFPAGINLGKDSSFCRTDGLVLRATDTFASYLWSNGAKTNFLNIDRPGTYSVKAYDSFGCASTDTIAIKESFCGFAIPTAFTPNRDGQNDVFRPRLSGTLTAYSFTIYDRWGKKVFATKSPAAGWDGYYNGQLQPAGSYIWICAYQIAGQQALTQKGIVLLIPG